MTAAGTIGGPCHRCRHARPVPGAGPWCAHADRPAPGSGCFWFRCRDRCTMPDGNGTLCLATGDLLPAGPCPADCVPHFGGRGPEC